MTWAGRLESRQRTNGNTFTRARAHAEQFRDGGATHDPRKSLEERYRSRDQYLAEITKAADALVAKGYLLKAEVARVVEQAGTRWDYAAGITTRTSQR